MSWFGVSYIEETYLLKEDTNVSIYFGDVNNDGIVEGLLKELTTGEGFIPIGNYGVNNTKFCGNFNGNDNEIINIYINRENTAYQGLFGFVEGNINKTVSGRDKTLIC